MTAMPPTDKSKQNDPKTRQQVKEYFRNGMLPSENDFSDLIDSMVNIKDDGFSKDKFDGLKLYAADNSSRFLTLYTGQGLPSYLKLEHDNTGGLKSVKLMGGDIQTKHETKYDQDLPYGNLDNTHETPENNTAFFLHLDGSVG